MRENEALLHKAYTEPVYLLRGSLFGDQTIPTSMPYAGVAFAASGFILGGQWEGSIYIQNPSSNAGTQSNDGYYYTELEMWNENVIDVTGLLAAGMVEIPIGTTSQKTEPPFLNASGEYATRIAPITGQVSYAREYVVWSTAPLTASDREGFFQGYSPVFPHMFRTMTTPPSTAYTGPSMTTAMVMGGRAELYKPDFVQGGNAGFLDLNFMNEFGMGDPVSCPKIYCTRLVQIVYTAYTIGDGVDWELTNFTIDWPASWELQSIVLAMPEEVEQLTTMRRSLIPPEGRE